MGLVFALSAFVGVLMATKRSLGCGFVAVFAVGYASGVVRANVLGVHTTFMFDAAVLGLYLVVFTCRTGRSSSLRSEPAGPMVLFLIAWPALLCLIPINNFLVQLVALRSTVWLLPILLVATRLTASDLALITRGLVVLNLVALAGGIYVYLHGVEALFPKNAITQIIYRSGDIAGNKYHRIPSIFLSAHAYGGTMLLTLPFLLDRVSGIGVRLTDRVLATIGVVAAAGGLLMCGARLPIVQLVMALMITWALTRFSLGLGLVGAILVGVGVWVANTNERFQRAATLSDTNYVANRVAGSANDSFFALAMDYPMGAGMGSAVGNSIPFFLADQAPEQVGMENEFCRILVDQGWIGLGAWLAFVGWLCVRPPRSRPAVPWRIGVVFMYAMTMTTWMTAFIGTGTLSSVPGSALLLCQMGILAAVRTHGAVPGSGGFPPRTVRPASSGRGVGLVPRLQAPGTST